MLLKQITALLVTQKCIVSQLCRPEVQNQHHSAKIKVSVGRATLPLDALEENLFFFFFLMSELFLLFGKLFKRKIYLLFYLFM